jgi:hypothetical protein
MLPSPTPQLSDEQIQQIEEARKAIPKVRKEIQRAQMAGIDMTQQLADLNATEAQLDKLYRVYVRNLTGTPKP